MCEVQLKIIIKNTKRCPFWWVLKISELKFPEISLNLLPNDKFLDRSELIAIANDKINNRKTEILVGIG